MILEYAADGDLRTLSVRGLAARMRVSDASIHYHFGSREQLLNALVDALTSDFEPPPGQADWRAWLRDFAHRARRSLRAHPGAADYMLLAGPVAGRQYAIIERALEVLQGGGLEPRESWLIYATTVNYVLRQVQAEEAHAAKTAPGRRTDHRMAATLDAPQTPPLPRLKAVVDSAWLADFDRLFDYGLEALLRGFGPMDRAEGERP
ncbi:TetR/AcrR family transcriptional regulator C-terminal domain-containing protein [Phenylobacterium sp.]|uniref:TetR/AcrR family transcriptional regulator C-terminal domain-containing protein n=1 Tax=Phenylobacterium sp. TaxID=1871053 RepID=UPI0028A1C6EF|nr:TetR/AcrR family transcriptional regulator C-terminal domain-containing protein [Phenylobacterium sp.]